MNAFINFFMPPSAKSATPETVVSMRFLVIVLLVLIGMFLPFVVMFFAVFSAPGVAAIVFGDAVFLCLLLWAYHLGLSFHWTKNLVVAATSVLIWAVIVVTGGMYAPGMMVISSITALAFVMLGNTLGWFWAGASSLFGVVMVIMSFNEIPLPMLYNVDTKPLLQAFYVVQAHLITATAVAIMESRSVAFRKAAEADKEAARLAKDRAEAAASDLAQEKASVESRVHAATLESEEQRHLLENNAGEILAVLRRLASGDFTASVELHSSFHPRMNDIATTLNETVGNISTLLRQLKEAVGETNEIAAQVSTASNQMSATAEEQAAQTGEVSISVEAMARALGESAQQTAIVAALSKSNGTSASKGTATMQEVIGKFNDIARVVEESVVVVQRLGDSSAEIGEIVQVIEEIADQTNLLALNAAIEAARAGDQGRGFAVVADEVRKLAERTAQATKQIATTIRQIQRETTQAVVGIRKGNSELSTGLTLAKEAGASLNNIVSGAKEVDESLRDVAQMGREQSTTGNTVAQNVEQIASAVEETAAGITHIAASAERLSNVTAHLQRLIARFRVVETAATSPARHLESTSQAKQLVPSTSEGELVSTHRYGEVRWRGNLKILHFIWFPETAQMLNREFQERVGHLASLCEKYRPACIYVDAVENRHVVTPNLLEWHDTEIVPRYVASGVRKMAFLTPKQALSASSTEEIFQEDTAAMQLQVKFFDNEETLLKWLQS